jgi:hypothetical protein
MHKGFSGKTLLLLFVMALICALVFPTVVGALYLNLASLALRNVLMSPSLHSQLNSSGPAGWRSMRTGLQISPGLIAIATSELEMAASWTPFNPEVHRQLGIAALLRTDDMTAARSLNRAVELRPGDLMSHYELGWLYKRIGR